MPNTPPYVQGVLNLRGAIVPIVDLRIRLGMPQIEYESTTVIVVLQVESEAGTRTVGVVVDAVSDVCSVGSNEVQGTPDFGEEVDTRFMHGILPQGERLVIILDVDKLLKVENFDTDAVAASAAAEPAQ